MTRGQESKGIGGKEHSRGTRNKKLLLPDFGSKLGSDLCRVNRVRKLRPLAEEARLALILSRISGRTSTRPSVGDQHVPLGNHRLPGSPAVSAFHNQVLNTHRWTLRALLQERNQDPKVTSSSKSLETTLGPGAGESYTI